MSPLPPPPLEVLGAIGLLLAVAFVFSGTQAAYGALQKPERERFSRGTASEKRVGWLLSRRGALEASLSLGNESANVATVAVIAWWLSTIEPIAPHVVWWSLLLTTPLVVLLADMTPGILGARFRRSWAPIAAWPVWWWFWITSPVRFLLAGSASTIARLLRVEEAEGGVAEEELLAYVDSSTATGQLDPSERDIIEAVFEFDDLTVERLMTPRPDVFSLPLSTPWSALLASCREAQLSRVPITGQTAEDIIGLLLLKDLLKFRTEPPTPRQLRSLLLPPIFVPASKPADAMLREFLAKRFHLAFVVDEHGTFVGVVTLDDLLRELVGGEDEEEEEDDIASLPQGALTVKASIDIEDFTQETGIELPDGNYHTLGGFVFHQLGRLPRRGESVIHGRHEFIIAHMEGRRVAELVVRDLVPDDGAAPAEEPPPDPAGPASSDPEQPA